MPENHDNESRRLERVYGRYGADPRTQARWSAENRGNVAIRRELVVAVFALAGRELARTKRILDVGCGTGWWLAELAARGVPADLHGLDALDDRVAAAAQRVPRAQIRVGDARSLPYEAKQFGVVSLLTVLSSLNGRRDVDLALAEARRVLAPEGVVIVWEPRLPNPRNHHTRVITLRTMRRAWPEAELEVRPLTLMPAIARRLGARTERMYPKLAAVAPLRSHRLVGIRPSRQYRAKT